MGITGYIFSEPLKSSSSHSLTHSHISLPWRYLLQPRKITIFWFKMLGELPPDNFWNFLSILCSEVRCAGDLLLQDQPVLLSLNPLGHWRYNSIPCEGINHVYCINPVQNIAQQSILNGSCYKPTTDKATETYITYYFFPFKKNALLDYT